MGYCRHSHSERLQHEGHECLHHSFDTVERRAWLVFWSRHAIRVQAEGGQGNRVVRKAFCEGRGHKNERGGRCGILLLDSDLKAQEVGILLQQGGPRQSSPFGMRP